MAEIISRPWVELAILPPGQSHYWFFDQPHDLRGWVFQAAAYPEQTDDDCDGPLTASRVEVSELFIGRQGGPIESREHRAQVNITVTNCGDRWAGYSLWVVSTPSRSGRRRARRPNESSTRRDSSRPERSPQAR
jgi:hypothetical protein